ncbi:Major facilitator superfamily domain-containing protein 7 [Seminavis robusta]|uniref:Major facilitator superfamily domain-containing protein 7 n=1 Tax=Seminavis robusta TaxID=568900 RepID=A0A9N8HCG7_9STRA|nr:Major facilitator superfamily domain-containing protein 7 [Seminavis robusta]|eukprot:Sro381_g130860.1 Major facilitator superfamily domain-containing protein 7 (1018) ;mRNA; f:47267-50320
MAVCQPIVSAKESGSAASAMENKPVVTPDAAKSVEGSPTPTASDSEWLQGSPVSDPSTANSNDTVDNDEDSSQADSSDGESSYFAKHLPSPKSGRRFSYSSSGSAPARTTPFMPTSTTAAATKNRASDASLSFSDESDDELPLSEPIEPVARLPSQVADMQLQRITRVHSVSSLVSSDGSNSHPKAGVLSPESTLSRDSSNSSVNAEHSTVVASPKDSAGRRQPEAPAYNVMGYYQGHPEMNPYGPIDMQHQMMMAAQIHQQQLNQFNSLKYKSDGTLPFVYSDDETEDTPFMHQLATDGHGGSYNTFPSQGGGSGGGSGTRGNGPPAGGNGGDPYAQLPGGQNSNEIQGANGAPMISREKGNGSSDSDGDDVDEDDDFKVYWQRWIMLFYMSMLNLLSDWTCYSVAPIAILTQQTFGDVDPERLVVIFLGANAISTACEPIILARLGLKKTVLFGSLLLMIGSMIKSGGIPPIIQAELVRGEDEWRLSFGFFLVGLSQPLYQCTPALLSASWFPEHERTMATGVALNANQLGIGCAFVFGTLLVATSDDIPAYFGLLSIISTLAFFGTLFQFDDAPPTPPSSSAKVMKGDITVPNVGSIMQSVRGFRGNAPPMSTAVAPAPSPALNGRTPPLSLVPQASAPSPMEPGPTDQENTRMPLLGDPGALPGDALQGGGPPGGFPMYPEGFMPHPGYQHPYAVPGMPAYPYYQQPYYQNPPYPGVYPPPPYPGYQNPPYPGVYPPPPPHPLLQGPAGYGYNLDEGAEPVVTVSDHHLDILIRDDQVIQSTRACLARPGFLQCLVSFTVSGIVINTLSTFMDYLVTLDGAGREYVGIIGGSFQGIIMISSLVIGKQTDKTRAYYSVIIAMLVFGAFGLAFCGVSLDADRGSDLRYSLLIVAALVGPLQPVSTELGVEVAYPLSENTVLVIQQLFSNLLSALFIPFFKSLKDIGISKSDAEDSAEQPEYTFSFYLLILLHAAATVFFATYNGRYLRYEHELEKLAAKENKKLNGGGGGENKFS